MFHAGQKVVCVRNEPQGQELKYSTGKRSTKLMLGEIYTIREIDCRAVHLHGVACVRLHEITNAVKNTVVGVWEPGYPITCFRPVTERPNDAEAFVRKLKDACAPKQKEKEREGAS